MRISALILLSVLSAVLLLSPSQPEEPAGDVNAVLRNESFAAVFGRSPTATDSEDLRIRTHLTYVETLLRNADVSRIQPDAREERSRLLDALAHYRQRGEFPTDFPEAGHRRPCFIDAGGRICAVGYLIEQSDGRDVAEAIASGYRYDLVEDMPESLLLDWARRSGFTLGELAMIQPAYGGIPDPDGPMLSTAVESGVLAVASLLAGANTALIASERGPRWTGAAGAVLGGSVLALALNNESNYRGTGMAVGGVALGLGLLQVLRPRGRTSAPELTVSAMRDRVEGQSVPGLHARWRF